MDKKVGFTQCDRFTCLEDLEQATDFSAISGLNLDYCGEEKCERGYSFGPYVREHYVMHIILDGKGVYQYRGNKIKLSKGQAFLIYPGDETIYQADRKEPWHYVWVGFHGYRAKEFINCMGFRQGYPVVNISNLDKIEGCMKHMLESCKLTVMNELVRMSQLLEIFALIMADNHCYIGDYQNDYPGTVYVRYAMDYMRSHMKEKIKIDDIAEKVGISRSHLCGIFKKELNMSPQEYLINLRMEYAAKLLRDTSDLVNMIAAECGYEDALAFSKAFKVKYDMSPKEYRNLKVEVVNLCEKGDYTGDYPL